MVTFNRAKIKSNLLIGEYSNFYTSTHPRNISLWSWGKLINILVNLLGSPEEWLVRERVSVISDLTLHYPCLETWEVYCHKKLNQVAGFKLLKSKIPSLRTNSGNYLASVGQVINSSSDNQQGHPQHCPSVVLQPDFALCTVLSPWSFALRGSSVNFVLYNPLETWRIMPTKFTLKSLLGAPEAGWSHREAEPRNILAVPPSWHLW